MFQPYCGLSINACFSALKLRWWLDHSETVRTAVKQGRCLFGTVNTWLLWVRAVSRVLLTPGYFGYVLSLWHCQHLATVGTCCLLGTVYTWLLWYALSLGYCQYLVTVGTCCLFGSAASWVLSTPGYCGYVLPLGYCQHLATVGTCCLFGTVNTWLLWVHAVSLVLSTPGYCG